MKTKMFVKKSVSFICVIIVASSLLAYGTVRLGIWLDNLVPAYVIPSVHIARAEVKFDYTDIVPKEIIIDEIKKQAKEFKLSEKLMLDLAKCESTYTNWKKNPKSTAKGVYQFISSTWDSTSSGKARISPYDYKANIREAMIKMADGQFSHWDSCL